jgi:hypothetical protein
LAAEAGQRMLRQGGNAAVGLLQCIYIHTRTHV